MSSSLFKAVGVLSINNDKTPTQCNRSIQTCSERCKLLVWLNFKEPFINVNFGSSSHWKNDINNYSLPGPANSSIVP